MTSPKITKERLQKRDNFRVQVQFNKEEDKILFAVSSLFLKEYYPANVEEVRDYAAPVTKKKLIQVMNTLSRSNRDFKSKFSKWREENVEGPELLREINQIVRTNLDL